MAVAVATDSKSEDGHRSAASDGALQASREILEVKVSSGPVAMHTFTGRSLVPQAPTPDAISIKDIAHALSQQCRFAGQIGCFYSVAQHSVICSQLCAPEDALAGLLHDAAEAYLGDLPRPVKAVVGERYHALDVHLTTVILQQFGLAGPLPPSVIEADDLLCRVEAHELFPDPPAWASAIEEPMTHFRILPWGAMRAETEFLKRFHLLSQGRYR